MLRLMNDPRHRHVHATRARRRGLVAAHVVLTAAALAALAPLTGRLTDPGPRWAALAALLLLTAAWCVVTGMLNLATRGLMELRARVLDERQHAERGRAFVLAHRTSLGLHLAALLWVLLAYGGGYAEVSARTLAGTVLVLLVAHWLLPLWAAVLTARDEPDEPDEPDEGH
jgi:MFS family permease